MPDIIEHGKTVIASDSAVAAYLKTAGDNLNCLEYGKKILDAKPKRGTVNASEIAMTAANDSILTAEYIAQKRAVLLEMIHDGSITPDELDMLKPGYFTFQDSLAQKALLELSETERAEKLSNVVMFYNINERSEFVRGCMSNGIPLEAKNEQDKKAIAVIDQTFHSWLVSNNMISKQGVIFKTDQLDKEGKPTLADPQTVSALLNDPVKGLGVVMKKQDKSFGLEVRQRQTKPTPEAMPEVGSSSTMAAKTVETTEPKASQGETPEPDTGPGAAG
ncbi:MAG: hypothetical protein Q8R24_03730 [Legionellaceae bacterium]|nr:hypothetical protein [Legionellaceae bacterium]